MNDTEKYIVEHINDKKFKFPKEFDPLKDYSDEFYEVIKKVFLPNKKKRYFYRFIKRCSEWKIRGNYIEF